MKLSIKVFLCYMLIFSAAFLLSGVLFIRYSYERAVAQEKWYALNQFQYAKYVLQSSMYSRPQLADDRGSLSVLADSLDNAVALYDGGGELLYSGLSSDGEPWELAAEASRLDGGKTVYRISWNEDTGRAVILTGGALARGGENAVPLWLITETDITATVQNQHVLIRYFQRLYLIILGVSFAVILGLTRFLLRPVAGVSAAAARIGEGNYGERIAVKSRDEIGELAENFNRLAETVEAKIGDLTAAARQREDFVANFAHELKTPLTSMIGYADILCRDGVSPEEVREYAECILSEGMRLETLSGKLMEMFLLNRQTFVLEREEAGQLLEDIRRSVVPLCEKRGVRLLMRAENGWIRADYDLFKSMLANLIDNAAKSGADTVRLTGRREGGNYVIAVRDNGRGIPAGEISRITEAFYMVDKARSRREHSVGLGLTLSARIAEIHGSRLRIESDGKSFSEVRLELALAADSGVPEEGEQDET